MDGTRTETPRPYGGTRTRTGIVVALIAAGLTGAGATAIVQKHRATTLVALAPQPVSALKDGTDDAIKGSVAEIFGNEFVLQDDSGRALVETGPAGEGAALVGKGEAVTVQGRFDRGVLHAAAIVHADGHADALDPPPPPPPRRGGPDRGPPAP